MYDVNLPHTTPRQRKTSRLVRNAFAAARMQKIQFDAAKLTFNLSPEYKTVIVRGTKTNISEWKDSLGRIWFREAE